MTKKRKRQTAKQARENSLSSSSSSATPSSSSTMSISPSPEPEARDVSPTHASTANVSAPPLSSSIGNLPEQTRETNNGQRIQSNPNGQTPPSDRVPAAPLTWSEAERQEALLLVREVTSAGVAPVELVRRGVRADVVLACCRQLGIAFEGEAQSSTAAGQSIAIPVEQVSATTGVVGKSAKRKRRKGAAKDAALSDVGLLQQSSSPSQSKSEAAAPAAPDDGSEQDDIEDMLRKKVELQRERAVLLRMERQRQQEAKAKEAAAEEEDTPPQATLASANTDSTTLALSVEAMRRAALASMKRKRADEKLDSTAVPETMQRAVYRSSSSSESPHSAGTRDTFAGPPPNAPRGPKHASTASRYRDIDAADADMAPLEYEAEEQDDGGDGGNEAIGLSAAAARNALVDGRRSKPLVYVDDDFHYEVGAPAGQVDYSAPLPTLAKPAARGTEVRVAAATRARRAPFLSSQLNHVVVEFSDDDDDDDDDDDEEKEADEEADAKRLRNANVRTITAAYKQHDDRSRSGTPAVASGGGDGTPTQTQTPTQRGLDTQALLKSKEREIAELKRKMEAYEQRKAAAAAAVTASAGTEAVHADSKSTNGNGSGSHTLPTEEQGATTAVTAALKTMPEYESPFSRYPGLRHVIEQQQQTKAQRRP